MHGCACCVQAPVCVTLSRPTLPPPPPTPRPIPPTHNSHNSFVEAIYFGSRVIPVGVAKAGLGAVPIFGAMLMAVCSRFLRDPSPWLHQPPPPPPYTHPRTHPHTHHHPSVPATA
jgi:hypothetical protein